MLYEVASRRQANFSCCPQPPKTLAFMRGFFIRKKARGLQREFIQRQQDISDRKRREAQAQRTQTLQMLEALEESNGPSLKTVVARWLSWMRKPSHRSK